MVSAFDDGELLAALRRGKLNRGAATALHDRVRLQIDRTIRRLLGPNDFHYEDIAQQALIEFLSTVAHYRSDCSLDAWISAITAHIVYKDIRRRKLERRLFGVIDADLLAETRSSSRTAHEAVLRQAVCRVRDLLEEIDESKVWAFILHDVYGYNLHEIARITGVSEAAAQTRLFRGRRRVHERIASDPELANLLKSMEGER